MDKFIIWVIYLILAQIGILIFNTNVGLDAFTATFLHAISFFPFFLWIVHDIGQPLTKNKNCLKDGGKTE